MHPRRQHALRRELLARDPKLAPIFAMVPVRHPRQAESVPKHLMQAIVSQQLSTRVAQVIWERFETLCGEVSPERVLSLSDGDLRACGLSRQKSDYLRNTARFVLENDCHPATLAQMSDEEVIHNLTRIKGVGRWTVEMLLIFVLNRPDVLPVDDLGIQQAMRRLYGMRSQGRAFRRRMEFYALPWRPHRSLVVRCLWRWVDGDL